MRCIYLIVLHLLYIAYRVSIFFSINRAKKQYEKKEIPNNDRWDAVQSLIRSSCCRMDQDAEREKGRNGKGRIWGEPRPSVCGIRGIRDALYVVLPREIFLLFEFFRATPYPLCSSRYPLIDIPRQEMRYRGNDTYVSEGRNRCDAALRRLTRHSDQWITHRSISLRFPKNFEVRVHVYQIFLAECIETYVWHYVFSMIKEKVFWE